MTRSRRTVVIVDDDVRFRGLAAELLTASGFEVVGEVSDAGAALAAVRRQRPHCVLIDICLPDTDGLAVARALSREPDPPVIVLTSTDPEVRRLDGVPFVPKDRLFHSDLQGLFSSPGT